MPTDVKLYRVFIASPRDAIKERKIIREEIDRWNSANATEMKICLLPVGWDTDAIPEMGKSGQELINRQLVDNCDLLIGVFLNRLGTPTKNAESGTVEEIELAIEQGKHCMVYFSDSSNKNDREEYKKLQEYKEKLNKRGLTASFKDRNDFKEKVSRNITKVVHKIAKEDIQRRAAEKDARETEKVLGLNLPDRSINLVVNDNNGRLNLSVLNDDESSQFSEASFENFQLAQNSIRKLVNSQFAIQDLEDIKEREITRIKSALDSPELATLFSEQPTIKSIPAIVQIIETATIPSIYALAAIGKYGDDSSDEWIDIVCDWIEGLFSKEIQRYNWAINIKNYPALLAVYALGIYALRNSKVAFLKEVLERRLYSHQYNTELSLMYFIYPYKIFEWDIDKLIEPGFDRRFTPISDHLCSIFKDILFKNEREEKYLEWFDFFELLLSLKAADLQDCYIYVGSYLWRRDPNKDPSNRFMIKLIQDAATGTGRYGQEILKLFNNSISDFKNAVERYQEEIKKRNYYDRFPPVYISNLIEMGQRGERVADWSEFFYYELRK